MGIKSVKVERKDPPSATIEWCEASLRFRRPRTDDAIPDHDAMLDAQADYPGLGVDTAWLCMLLGACYLPDPEDGEIVGWREFAVRAQANDIAFSDLCRSFDNAFPEFSLWLRGRLKNAPSASGSASDAVSPESPSPQAAPSESAQA